jgi:hypothetical protein
MELAADGEAELGVESVVRRPGEAVPVGAKRPTR